MTTTPPDLPDFGTDFSSADDLDETRVVSGLELVAQDALWILRTPPNMGVMEVDAPAYGLDLEDEIGKATTPSEEAALPDKIRNALTSDERIQSVTTSITRLDTGGPGVGYDIAITCETAEGPFALVGLMNDEGLELAIKLLPEVAT